MDERVFVDAQESSRKVPAHHWSKNEQASKQTNESGCFGEGKRASLTLLVNPPPRQHSSVPREPFSAVISPGVCEGERI